MEDKTVVVIGPARSGTSMTAGILHCLGVDMNPDLEPTRLTPRGTFECINWHQITVDIRKDMKAGMSSQELTEKYRPRIEEFKRRGLWGFKSALTLYCMPVIFPFLENPHLVFVWRNPETNARSKIEHAASREGKKMAFIDAFEIIMQERSKMDGVREFYPCPHIDVSFERIKSNPVSAGRYLAEFLKIGITPAMCSEIEQLVLPDYCTWRKPTVEA